MARLCCICMVKNARIAAFAVHVGINIDEGL